MVLYPQVEVAAATSAIIGETPVWDPVLGALFWVDILGSRIFRYRLAGEEVSSFPLSGIGGCVGLADRGLVLTVDGAIATCTIDGEDLEVGRPLIDQKNVRFNDGRVDAMGRLYVGTMDWKESEPLGQLYLVGPDLAAEVVAGPFIVSNGLDFTDGGDGLYHIDSPSRGVDRYQVDRDSGRLYGRSRFFEVAPAFGEPDGLVVDADGLVWVAMWGGGRVVAFTPSGKVERVVELPVSQPTGITFGGPDLNELFVASARDGLSAAELERQPLAGALFRVDVGAVGRPSHRFKSG